MVINGLTPGFFMMATAIQNRAAANQAAQASLSDSRNLQQPDLQPSIIDNGLIPTDRPATLTEVNGNSLLASLRNTLSELQNRLMNSVGSIMNRFGNLLFPGSVSTGNHVPIRQPQPILQPLPIQSDVAPRTPQSIIQNLADGARQAFQNLGSIAHSQSASLIGMGGGMAVAGAICPFACGAVAATGATMLANQITQAAPQTAA